MLSLALGQQDSEFEHDHTLKEFSTWENESIKLAGKPQLIPGGDHQMCIIRPQYHAALLLIRLLLYACMIIKDAFVTKEKSQES